MKEEAYMRLRWSRLVLQCLTPQIWDLTLRQTTPQGDPPPGSATDRCGIKGVLPVSLQVRVAY